MTCHLRSLRNFGPLLLSLPFFFPPSVAAQDNRHDQNTITCSSNDGQRTYCDTDTRKGARLVRQLSGSPCRLDSTWGYDRRGVWVDQGCRGEFDLSGSSPNGMIGQTRNPVICRSSNGQRVYCEADTGAGVRLTRQISDYPCQQGATWGFDSRGIWVDQGCGAEFDLGANAANSRGPSPNGQLAYSNGQQAYSNGQQGNPNNQKGLIPAETEIVVRTNERINVRNSDGRVFSGVVERDVTDVSGRVAVPRGSSVELTVRGATSQLVLDLESVTVNGQRFALDASADQIGARQRDGVGVNNRTGEYVGGGALLGTILGAIAGGGKGAAIGAAAGAGAGVGTQVLTRGARVNLPAESLVTFRLDRAIETGVIDDGVNRNGRHYHVRAR